MTHKLTTEQLFALDKGETTVRELFPDLFQMKVGGYYGVKEFGFMFCITGFNKDGALLGFGFANETYLFSDIGWCVNNDERLKPLNPEELQTFAKMIENEAVERWYKEGVRVKCLDVNDASTILKGQYFYNFETHELWYGYACIFKNGIWAEILT